MGVTYVGIDLHQLAQRPTNLLTYRPDRGPSPRRGWWAPVAQSYKEEVGTDGSGYEIRRRHCSPPQNPNPIREGGCSGGKRHHAITGLPSPLHRCTTTPSRRRLPCTATSPSATSSPPRRPASPTPLDKDAMAGG